MKIRGREMQETRALENHVGSRNFITEAVFVVNASSHPSSAGDVRWGRRYDVM